MNGVLIVLFRVHPLVITMGTLLTLRGVNLAITDGHSVSGFSDAFLFLGQGKILRDQCPHPFLRPRRAHPRRFARPSEVLSPALFHWRRRARCAFVRASTSTGSKLSIYMLSASLAGCAGIMAAAKYGAAHWAHGNLAELKAIAAVAIGGANINGGSGTIGGTVLGVIFLAVVHNAFVTSAVNTFWYDVVSGSMLLIAVLLSRFISLRNTRALLGLKQSKMDQCRSQAKS